MGEGVGVDRGSEGWSTVTDEELNELEALANEATPGPWRVTADPVVSINVEAPSTFIAIDYWERDANFVVAARDALPRLIAEVRQLREELARANARLGVFENAEFKP